MLPLSPTSDTENILPFVHNLTGNWNIYSSVNFENLSAFEDIVSC